MFYLTQYTVILRIMCGNYFNADSSIILPDSEFLLAETKAALQ